MVINKIIGTNSSCIFSSAKLGSDVIYLTRNILSVNLFQFPVFFFFEKSRIFFLSIVAHYLFLFNMKRRS